MLIIYGRRSYGRADECGDEYAHTRFFHVYYLPLVPTSSFWVTREADGQTMGLPIALDLKRGAAYLRTWAPVIAVGSLASASIIGVASALVLLALSAGSYRWRWVRGAHARKRSDFNLLAYGTRCDPSRFDAAQRRSMRASLDQRRVQAASPRPPEDVSRFGAANLDEAVIAYGLLRLAALEHRGGDDFAAADACSPVTTTWCPMDRGRIASARPRCPTRLTCTPGPR